MPQQLFNSPHSTLNREEPQVQIQISDIEISDIGYPKDPDNKTVCYRYNHFGCSDFFGIYNEPSACYPRRVSQIYILARGFL